MSDSHCRRSAEQRNGLVVVEKQKVNGPTAHGAKGDVAEAPIWLQGYQRTVLFRNVWLVESK